MLTNMRRVEFHFNLFGVPHNVLKLFRPKDYLLSVIDKVISYVTRVPWLQNEHGILVVPGPRHATI